MEWSLRVHAVAPRFSDLLGPGRRAVVWVQGCSIHCRGCLVPETWPSAGGELVDPRELAERLLVDRELDGITISGGEPTEQAKAVAELLAAFRGAGKSAWVYTGRQIEDLVARDDPSVDLLLSLADVLVDGPYREDRAVVSSFRGSTNQRLVPLTATGERECLASRVTARLQLELESSGELRLYGVPPPGFLGGLERRLRARGVSFEDTAVADRESEPAS